MAQLCLQEGKGTPGGRSTKGTGEHRAEAAAIAAPGCRAWRCSAGVQEAAWPSVPTEAEETEGFGHAGGGGGVATKTPLMDTHETETLRSHMLR